jgi:hypothetical protein
LLQPWSEDIPAEKLMGDPDMTTPYGPETPEQILAPSALSSTPETDHMFKIVWVRIEGVGSVAIGENGGSTVYETGWRPPAYQAGASLRKPMLRQPSGEN